MGRRLLAWAVALGFALAPDPARADPGREIVLLLDNSASMIVGSRVEGSARELPPNDPERAAVLGAMIVEGLARGSEDRVTIVGFGVQRDDPHWIGRDGAALRAMPYGGGTWFVPALRAAGDVLGSTRRDGRLLVLFTDGFPSDLNTPEAALDLLGATPQARPPIVALGLYGASSSRAQGQQLLSAMVSSPEDLAVIDATGRDAVMEVVGAFTRSYARALGSRPITARLRAGGELTLPVGRYVTEVLVAAAAAQPGPPFTATLSGPSGDVAPRATGDNGCPDTVAPGNAPQACAPPRRSFMAFRGANDPMASSTWTLRVPQAPDEVVVGVILRYDLAVDLDLPARARVGEAVPVDGKLLFRGQTFQDEAFFAADDFAMTVRLGGEGGEGGDEVLLTHAGGGRFTGTWTPTAPGEREAMLTAHNTWLDLRDTGRVDVEGFLDLDLRPTPNPIELGSWAGERGSAERCADIDLSGSRNADQVPVTCAVEGQSDGAGVSCAPVPGSEAALASGKPGQPLRWRVCVRAEGCCDALPGPTDEPFVVTFQGAHPHYAAGAVRVPVRWSVTPTGWWACWWIEVLTAVGACALGVLVYGFLSPNSFDPALSVRVAGSEAGMRRASALVLCEQPGGRRGWYRSARLALAADGSPVRDLRRAAVALHAGPRGTTSWGRGAAIERFDRRASRWVALPPEDLAAGADPGVVYRCGAIYLKFQ
jgi:hypothetical protein